MRVPLKKKHNTRVTKEAFWTTVRLYNTDIFRYNENNRRLVLDTGGWETMTTRRRMYEAVREICEEALHGRAFNIYSKKGTSVFILGDKEYPFVDGRLEITL